MGSTIQMYASAVPADALASIDVPANGFLEGVDWLIALGNSGADIFIRAQLAFSSTNQLGVNDARAVISNIGAGGDLTTSGVIQTVLNKFVKLPNLKVAAGERIYLHAVGTAVASTYQAVLHFSFDLDMARSRMR